MAWLLGESRGAAARAALAEAELVLTSELTLIECDRSLIRAAHAAVLSASKVSDLRVQLRVASEHWTLLPVQTEIADRARQPFPREPVRTLDALHLATIVVARALVPGIRVLSLDDRIRGNARDLGFEIIPT